MTTTTMTTPTATLTTPPSTAPTLVTTAHLTRYLTISAPTITDAVKAGKFPAPCSRLPMQANVAASLWDEADVVAWFKQRLAAASAPAEYMNFTQLAQSPKLINVAGVLKILGLPKEFDAPKIHNLGYVGFLLRVRMIEGVDTRGCGGCYRWLRDEIEARAQEIRERLMSPRGTRRAPLAASTPSVDLTLASEDYPALVTATSGKLLDTLSALEQIVRHEGDSNVINELMTALHTHIANIGIYVYKSVAARANAASTHEPAPKIAPQPQAPQTTPQPQPTQQQLSLSLARGIVWTWAAMSKTVGVRETTLRDYIKNYGVSVMRRQMDHAIGLPRDTLLDIRAKLSKQPTEKTP